LQLARDLTGYVGIAPADAWRFLRNIDHPLVAELVRLLDDAIPL
jgi:hypothetical protein